MRGASRPLVQPHLPALLPRRRLDSLASERETRQPIVQPPVFRCKGEEPIRTRHDSHQTLHCPLPSHFIAVLPR